MKILDSSLWIGLAPAVGESVTIGCDGENYFAVVPKGERFLLDSETANELSRREKIRELQNEKKVFGK